MGRKTIDRIGEINVNNFGSQMIIVEYRMNKNIDVYFPEYDWIAESVQYNEFQKGSIRCPYEPRVYNHGYLGKGKHKTQENGKDTKCYATWHNMMQRCYDSKWHKRQPTYKGCTVDEEWLNFQNFANWFEYNYYEIEGRQMCLDKDILVKGNRIYSADTCIFVPHRINSLFIKSDKIRGELPVGVQYYERYKKFRAQCSIYDLKENKNKIKSLGHYDTPEEAFEVYKQFKENYIKEVADYYKDKIPSKLYDAMYRYEIDITD